MMNDDVLIDLIKKGNLNRHLISKRNKKFYFILKIKLSLLR